MASQFTKSTMSKGKDEVYVAAMPLRAAKGPAQLVMSAAYSLNLWDLQHFMVIVKPSSRPQAVVFDFQPKDPENIYTALAVLSGQPMPGVVLVRKLKNMPRTKCWFIGSAYCNALDAANAFNGGWETDLRVGHHDCRDYANGLVEHLIGKKNVLEHLRRNSSQR
ncbi:hypothetical protein HS088_TW06G00301 [Tripterygium wilfordii]|uniref:PTB domain-containing engulfment adapter protein 1 n=1 Tax=Tripterygium wilfordii TaxID=458696 RepID=A0A7J7DJ90_TRIWF|nr:uncharacterized protein LOC119999640 [Tripterygium wilfordii]XP_038703257.1 uncharacterized protein LOC119999640 [Tripterygium wilfordii]XP_038703258.1 uncharacterized protein LOC119999640 [Tripterygium wilfordii]XP_038703259.1 uncharacterized protein LOC119999640 [Tripterygium wilfordii]XP_038703260.1 uncharacterized protein LOC119999640 [Tripterygium wilfordii]KAF5746136.1 hypothetical protein HS088_TW06G00301 [Tripterygium wilfordii]